MKSLNQHIVEKLIINKDLKISKNLIDPNDYNCASNLVILKIHSNKICVHVVKLKEISFEQDNEFISFRGDDIFPFAGRGWQEWNMKCQYYGDAMYNTFHGRLHYIVLPLSYIKEIETDFFNLFSTGNTITIDDISFLLKININDYLSVFDDIKDNLILAQINYETIDKINQFIKTHKK